MRELLSRRTFLRGAAAAMVLGLMGCASAAPQEEASQQSLETAQTDGVDQSEQESQNSQSQEDDTTQQEENTMQILVTVNDVPFTATIEDTVTGQALLERLPLTLSMDELHGNEKYCYTGESFGGESYVPGTIEAGDLLVFGPDCLVLFYETFANGGWSYARVGKIDDPAGLAEACGTGAATVTFEFGVR